VRKEGENVGAKLAESRSGVYVKSHAERSVEKMQHVMTRGNAYAIKNAEEMLDVMIGEYANAGEGVKSFHSAVEENAEGAPFVTREQENVDVTAFADNLVEYVCGEKNSIQNVQEDVEWIVGYTLGIVIEELGVASANTEECFLPAMDNGAPGLHGAVLARGAVLPVQGEPDSATILRQ